MQIEFCVLSKHSWIVILMKVSYIPIILMSRRVLLAFASAEKGTNLLNISVENYPLGWLSILIALTNLQLAVSSTYHILKSLGNTLNLFVGLLQSVMQIVSGMDYYW